MKLIELYHKLDTLMRSGVDPETEVQAYSIEDDGDRGAEGAIEQVVNWQSKIWLAFRRKE